MKDDTVTTKGRVHLLDILKGLASDNPDCKPNDLHTVTRGDLYNLAERIDMQLARLSANIARLDATLHQTAAFRDQQLQKGEYKCLSKLKRKRK